MQFDKNQINKTKSESCKFEVLWAVYSYDFLFSCTTVGQAADSDILNVHWRACLLLGTPWLILRFSVALAMVES